MINNNDDVVQIFSISNFSFQVKNRNLLDENEDNPGYSKEINRDFLLDITSDNNLYSTSLIKQKYDLTWNFFFSEEETKNFLKLISLQKDLSEIQERDSYFLYTSSQEHQNSYIEFEDNKIIDFFSGNYEKYNIIFSDIERIQNFNTKNKSFTITVSAKTI